MQTSSDVKCSNVSSPLRLLIVLKHLVSEEIYLL